MRVGATALRRYILRPTLAAIICTAGLAAQSNGAFALSQLKSIPGADDRGTTNGELLPPEDVPADELPNDGALGIPDPDPLINSAPADDEAVTDDSSQSGTVEVEFDLDKLPEPVKRMRQLIIDATATGDVSKLKPLMNPGPNQTQLQLSGSDSDPVDVLKGFSGDDDGIEILAIIEDLLAAGYARVNAGTPSEMYVWPYFAEKPLQALTAPEKVQLFRIVTAGDFASMLEIGNYNFFRLGISPDGEWRFLLGGD